MAIYTLASLACAIAPSILIFTLCRLVQGLAGGAALVTANAMGRDLYSNEKLIHFFANLSTYSGTAAVISPLFGAQANRIMSWRGQFVLLSLIGILIGVVVWFGLPETLPIEQRRAGGASNLLHSLRKPLRDRKFTALAAMIGLQGSGIFIYLAGSTFAFQQIYGLSATMFATVFAVNSAGLTLSARIAGRISKRRNSAAALQAAILITLTGALGATIAAWRHYSVWAFGISLFLILCGLGMNGPASSSLAMQEQSENAGAASAILGLMRFSLGGMAAPIVGAVASDIAFSTGVMEFGAALLSVTIFFTIWKRD
jgi:DHA1 family bicyclomycin/chloramphenicol resistance-like MFS transporter